MYLFKNIYKEIEAEKDSLIRNPSSVTGRRETNANTAAEVNNVRKLFIIKAYTD